MALQNLHPRFKSGRRLQFHQADPVVSRSLGTPPTVPVLSQSLVFPIRKILRNSDADARRTGLVEITYEHSVGILRD
jgi:hypothetical protein